MFARFFVSDSQTQKYSFTCNLAYLDKLHRPTILAVQDAVSVLAD